MPTIGQKLGETRREKGISVEDVAHETRMHPNMILSIEEDDFSQFPSVAYARSFIRKYSDHLGVDLSSAMEELNNGANGRLGDNELMGEMKKTINKDRRFRLERLPKGSRRRIEKPGGAPLFLNFLLLLLIVSLGIFYFIGYRTSSMEEAKSEIAKGLGKANLFGEGLVPEGNTTPPAVPSPVSDPAPTKPKESPAIVRNASGGPHPAPQYPVIKPAVAVQFEDALTETPPKAKLPTDIPENPLRPRSTPRMVFAEEPVKPLSSGDLPAVKKPVVEPQAVLRPEGTDPAATRKEDTSAMPAPQTREQNGQGKPAPPQTAVRAVPVAASE